MAFDDNEESKEGEEHFEDLKIETLEIQDEGSSIRDRVMKKNKKKNNLNDPALIEELEEVFQSAHETFLNTK